MNEQDIYNALKEAYRRAGTQVALAKKAHLSQGRIADYLNKRYSIGNMTCSTLLRLFPAMKVFFFPEDKSNIIDAPSKSDDSVSERFSLERDKVILEKDRQIFELEKENWRLKRELEEAKNDVTTRLFGR